MKTLAFAMLATAMVAAPALAAPPQPLDDDALDAITAGDLGLPNGAIQFAGFDNVAPDKPGYICDVMGMCHPAFNRNLEHGYNTSAPGFEGPWAAARRSPVISCEGGGACGE